MIGQLMDVEQLVELERRGKPKYSDKIRHSATPFTTDLTWPALGLNPGNSGARCEIYVIEESAIEIS
jgi:hypothetical protein